MTTTRPTGDGSRPAGRGRARQPRVVALAVAATVTLTGALAGCTGDGARSRPGASGSQAPGVDELARRAAAQDAADLLLLARRATATTPALARVYDRLAEVHRAHLAALGAAEPPADGSVTGSATRSAIGSATASVTAAATAPAAAARPKDVLAAEWAAAGRALAGAQTAGPAMATLLVRIAAARAVDADLLARAAKLPVPGALRLPASATAAAGSSASPTSTATSTATSGASSTAARAPSSGPTGPSAGTGGPSGTGSPGSGADPARSAGSRQALNDLLLGEHAATFAYGLLAARASAGQQALAQTYWQDHLVARDLLESRIVEVGDSPPVPAPAYDVGPAPGSPQQVAALAGRVERGLASVASSAVATADPDIRPLAAGYLVTAARRAARWGAVDPLPGEPAPAAAATSTATG